MPRTEGVGLTPLEHSCNADIELSLRRLETYLCRYRCVADSASYYYAANTLTALRTETETTTDTRCLLSKVTRMTRALARAVGEWQEGTVP